MATIKPDNASIKAYVDQYRNDPGMIAKGMREFDVNLDDIQGATGHDRATIGGYVTNSGNDYLKNQYANWGSPAAAPSARETMLDQWYTSYMTAQPKPAAQARASQWKVDPTKTTQGLLPSITSNDSPIMRQAQEQSLARANSRGMLNTSQAVRDAQSSVYDKAIPIATADAGIYARAGESNAAAKTQTSMFNAGQSNSVEQANLDRMMTGATFGLKLEQDAKQFADRLGIDKAALDNEVRRTDLQNTQFYAGLSQEDRQFVDKLKVERDRLAQEDRQFSTEWDNRFSLDAQQQSGRIDLAQMDADNRVALAELEAGWRRDIAGDENIANAWGTMITEINRVQNNPELEAGAKATLIGNLTGSFQSYASFWKKLGNEVDISDLLDFNVAPPAAAEDAPSPAAPKPELSPGGE
jgi:hypothetical protein